jgi:DNA-binding MarR family transcriptional regulator
MPPPTDAVDRITAQWRRERPDLDPAAMGVVGRISRLALLAQRELETVFGRYDLNGGDFDVLATLRRSGAPYRLTPGELSRSTMVTTGGMTKRLDRLEDAGLIRRHADPSDRRGKLIALTPKGRDLVDHVLEEHWRNEERLLEGLSATQRRELASLLRALLASFEQRGAGGEGD